ncbi:MAG: protoporphyrinogen oxidase [Candidatus Eisenbacteria bacterium]
MIPRRVAVVGAGITGLALAHRLSSRARAEGIPLELAVFEAAPMAGGHVRTVREDGYVIEAGPNGFLDRSPGPLAMVRELGLDGQLIEARPEAKRRFLLRGGRLRRVPDSPATFFATDALSPAGKLRLLLELWARRAPEGREETVFEFARRRIGHEAADVLVDAAVSGISAGDSRTLSLPAAFPLMATMEREHGSLLLAMLARRRQGKGPARLLTFRPGMETLVEAAARTLGAALRLSTPVRGLTRANSRWRLELGGGASWEADDVALALPGHGASALARGFDPALAATLAETSFSGVAVVALAYRASAFARPLEGYGYLVTREEGLATLGVVWESTLFDGRAPAGHVLVRAILGGPRRPGVATLAPEERVALARREFAATMGVSAEPVRVWTHAWPHAIAQYTLGHAARLLRARELVSRHPGLTLAGTSYDGVSFGGAIETGRASADRILADDARHAPAPADQPVEPAGARA